MSARPTCPVCRRTVQLEMVNFANRMVERRVFYCGAVEQVLPAHKWLVACDRAMDIAIAAAEPVPAPATPAAP